MAYDPERINTPISTRDLERRWSAVRAAMNERRIDVLLMQNNNDHMGGYVKYFTDLPAPFGYPVPVVFPGDHRMSVIAQGPIGSNVQLPPEGDGLRRGVKDFMTTPSFASATIGLVGLGTLPVSLIDPLRRGRLSKANFVDASGMVDPIKVIKSEEELALIRRTAAVRDAAGMRP